MLRSSGVLTEAIVPELVERCADLKSLELLGMRRLQPETLLTCLLQNPSALPKLELLDLYLSGLVCSINHFSDLWIRLNKSKFDLFKF